MPQQLSLFSSIPNDELKMILQTLSSLTGMSPSPLLEHSLLWEPRHAYRPVMAAGQVNQIEQYRIRVSNDITELPAIVPPALKNAPSDYPTRKEKEILMKVAILSYNDPDLESRDAINKREWTLNIAELPEAGKRSVISQSILSSQPQIGFGSTPFQFLDKLGYVFRHEYWKKGLMYVHGNIVIQIFRLCQYSIQANQQQNGFLTTKAILAMDLAGLEALENLTLLDPTGRWTVQAFVNVELVTDIDAINLATAELEKFKLDVSGLLDLEMPDRNSFDTRVKRVV